jgi:hypothetical protein
MQRLQSLLLLLLLLVVVVPSTAETMERWFVGPSICS